jgi:hypothetical protein
LSAVKLPVAITAFPPLNIGTQIPKRKLYQARVGGYRTTGENIRSCTGAGSNERLAVAGGHRSGRNDARPDKTVAAANLRRHPSNGSAVGVSSSALALPDAWDDEAPAVLLVGVRQLGTPQKGPSACRPPIPSIDLTYSVVTGL